MKRLRASHDHHPQLRWGERLRLDPQGLQVASKLLRISHEHRRESRFGCTVDVGWTVVDKAAFLWRVLRKIESKFVDPLVRFAKPHVARTHEHIEVLR